MSCICQNHGPGNVVPDVANEGCRAAGSAPEALDGGHASARSS
ncbi:hypothetical protein [Roseateles sp. BYS96W]|uniref:Uncharacterized protein n=1 Tax=Pelomonas nitida TaxID=3299027 RepID=A0ABW7G924_9BURK